MAKDIFISYRRSGAKTEAFLLYQKLTEAGYEVFLDIPCMHSGEFDEEIQKTISECTDFILLVSPSCFKRCDDPDDTFRREIECALRETEEELGIPRTAIHPIARLDKMSGSRGVIYPLLARVDREAVAAMKADPWEVADTFLVPVDFFIEREPRLYRFPIAPDLGEYKKDFNELIGHPGGYPWKTGKDVQPIWIYENHLIWGLTAKILLWNFRNSDWK